MPPGMSCDDYDPSDWSKIKSEIKEHIEFFCLNDPNFWILVVGFLIPIILLKCV